jgi:UbiD family decarboxylase
MAQSLGAFLALLESTHPGEIVRVKGEVSPRFEATALAVELERGGRSPALLFERVSGSALPVLSNLFGTRRRYALALGTDEARLIDELERRDVRRVPPALVASAPCQEVVRTGAGVDLGELPILTHFREDAGPYLSAAALVARDPDTGVRNASLHRCQVVAKDRVRTSLHSRRHLWDYARRAEEAGHALPVALVVGAHPAFYLGGAVWKGPIDTDEYDVVGGFLGEPLEVVRARTVDLEVPANAEIVIEGEILPGVREPEGPFGEFTGYASARSTQHVIRVTAITRRHDAVYQDIVTGDAAEHLNLIAVPAEARLLGTLRANFPTVRDVSVPNSGAARFHAYVSMRPTAPGQAKNAIMATFAEDLSLKLVIVVDDDIDVRREADVLWAVATRMQADHDLFVVPNAMGAILDPSSRDGETAKVGIDATRPSPGFPERCSLPAEARERARQLIERLG